jgi:hypothetical protein
MIYGQDMLVTVDFVRRVPRLPSPVVFGGLAMFTTMRGLSLGLLVPLALGVAEPALAKTGPAHQGMTKTRMAKLHSVTANGGHDVEKDRACFTKFNGLLGDEAVAKYDIDPETLMMSAQVTFHDQSYDLEALGIAEVYAFGSFFNPPSQPLDAYGVIYSLSPKFANPQNEFILVLDDGTKCALSN